MSALISSMLAVTLALSAYAKFRDRATFKSVLSEYGVRSPAVRSTFQWFIPTIEIAIALLLATLRAPWIAIGAQAAIVFLAVVTAALAVRAMRGEKKFRCGCAGDLREQRDAGVLILRNVCLMFLCAAVMRLPGIPGSTTLERINAFSAGATALMGMKLVSVLPARMQELAEWKTSR